MNRKFIKPLKKAEFEKEKTKRTIAVKRHLVVIEPFNNLKKGSVITRPKSVYNTLKNYRRNVTIRSVV